MVFPTILPALASGAVYGIVSRFPALTLYALLSMSYEWARTLPRVKNAKWATKSFGNGYAGPDVPLLLTEKIAASTFCSLQGLYAAPVHLIEDIKRAELRLRGLDPLRFGYTRKDIESSHVYSSYLDIAFDSPVRATTQNPRTP